MEPRPPSDWVADLPDDLSRLCMDLIQRTPSLRPSGREVLERLLRREDGGEAKAGGTGERVAEDGAKPRAALVGRANDLGQLRAAFEAARAGRTAAALVHGRSG